MAYGFASRYTHVAASQTDSQIESGEPVQVWGIHASAGTAGTIRIEDASNNLIMLVDLATNGTWVLDVPFVAHAGLQVTTAADTTVTVFHNAPGA